MNMKWLAAIGEFLKGLTPMQRWLPLIVVSAIGLGWGIREYGRDIREVFEGDRLTPWQRIQMNADRLHVGLLPELIHENLEDGSSSYYYPQTKSYLSKHVWGDVEVRNWTPHPSRLPPPPEHEDVYGMVEEVETAGFGGAIRMNAQCAPREACWRGPPSSHPSYGYSEYIGEGWRERDECWYDTFYRIPSDGCVWAREYDTCWNRMHESWRCCNGRHR